MLLTIQNTKSLTDKEFFFALLKNNIKITIFYLIIAVFIFLAGKLNWYLGVILLAPFGLLGIISSLQSILPIFPTIAMTMTFFFVRKRGTNKEKSVLTGDATPQDQLYVLGSGIIQLFAGLFFLGIVIFLVRNFFWS